MSEAGEVERRGDEVAAEGVGAAVLGHPAAAWSPPSPRRAPDGRRGVTAPTVTLRGMTWDHVRGRAPLLAATADWVTRRDSGGAGGVTIEWDARPLKAFEDQPLEELTARYDLLVFDHPFTGTAAESGLVVAADEWLDDAYLADQRAGSVGPSFDSYTWDGRQWALAVDAATQVAAVRPDLVARLGVAEAPATWDDVESLAAETRDGPHRVAIALNPTHAYCTFLSLGVGLAGDAFWPPGREMDAAAAATALAQLSELAALVHPASAASDPIALSDRMATGNEIAHVPLMFGYSNYSRPGFRPHPLQFVDAPLGPSGRRGSVLGGVGIAVSARSEHRALAADFARMVAGAEYQRSGYVAAGGQPGHAAAWASPEANALVGDFFTATRATIDLAFTRPRVAGHRRFQELAGEAVHRFLWAGDMRLEDCLHDLQERAAALLGTGGPR